mmetsp:Transcript_35226/g.110063  ORF Transcript_35226/g.110063 Transcript_35226/m.110063 type:complete len:291 (+) Transcript_35226:1120-1992(+)
MLQPHHRCPPLPLVPIGGDGIHDVLVPPAEVTYPVLAALRANLSGRPHVPVERLALPCAIEVEGVRVEAEEANERKEFRDPVLQWGAREGPSVVSLQREDGASGEGGFVLDSMSLVQDDSVPVDLVEDRLVLGAALNLVDEILLLRPCAVPLLSEISSLHKLSHAVESLADHRFLLLLPLLLLLLLLRLLLVALLVIRRVPRVRLNCPLLLLHLLLHLLLLTLLIRVGRVVLIPSPRGGCSASRRSFLLLLRQLLRLLRLRSAEELVVDLQLGRKVLLPAVLARDFGVAD